MIGLFDQLRSESSARFRLLGANNNVVLKASLVSFDAKGCPGRLIYYLIVLLFLLIANIGETCKPRLNLKRKT